MLPNYLCSTRDKNQIIWLCFFIEDKVEVSIIVYIPYTHTENALKRSKNKEMWLGFYIEDKVVVSIIVSLKFHTVILIMLSNDSVISWLL